MTGTVFLSAKSSSGQYESLGSVSGALETIEASASAEKTYISSIFGDETTTEATVASTEEVSQAIDASLFDPNNGSISLTIAGSTAGDIYVDVSDDGVASGVNGWGQVHTEAYTAVGTYIIPLSSVGYCSYFRVRVTDSSATAGTIAGYVMAKGG